jgi:Pentapeptide repeats (8 copies)
MKIQIKNRFDNSVIFETEAANTREAVLAAISQKVSLRSADLRSADLRSADLRSADLRSADLSSAVLRSADLSSAVLSYAVLRSADLNAETQLPYAPKIPDLDKQILERVTNGGTLDMKDWHTCETTHCRAGWAVVIAGEAGKVLESMLGPQTAATLIYHASTGSIPNFFASNDEAMEDLRKCAGVAK